MENNTLTTIFNVDIAAETHDLAFANSELERQLLIRAIYEGCGNKSVVAGLLGVSRPTLYKMLRVHEVSCDRECPSIAKFIRAASEF